MNDPKVKIDWIGGQCPLQAVGTLDGHKFYFRARGNRWSFEVGENPPSFGNHLFYYEEPFGEEPYQASWMSKEEAKRFIDQAAKLFQAKQRLEEK